MNTKTVGLVKSAKIMTLATFLVFVAGTGVFAAETQKEALKNNFNKQMRAMAVMSIVSRQFADYNAALNLNKEEKEKLHKLLMQKNKILIAIPQTGVIGIGESFREIDDKIKKLLGEKRLFAYKTYKKAKQLADSNSAVRLQIADMNLSLDDKQKKIVKKAIKNVKKMQLTLANNNYLSKGKPDVTIFFKTANKKIIILRDKLAPILSSEQKKKFEVWAKRKTAQNKKYALSTKEALKSMKWSGLKLDTTKLKKARKTAIRTICKCNMKQILLALIMYHDEKKVYPDKLSELYPDYIRDLKIFTRYGRYGKEVLTPETIDSKSPFKLVTNKKDVLLMEQAEKADCEYYIGTSNGKVKKIKK